MKKLIILLIAVSCLGFAGKSLRPFYVTSPRELTFWLRSEFLYKGEDRGRDYWQSPSRTVSLKTGDCEDFAFLAKYVFDEIYIESHVIAITYRDTKIGHAICVFRDGEGWSYFSNQYYIIRDYDSVYELVKNEYPQMDFYEYVMLNKEVY